MFNPPEDDDFFTPTTSSNLASLFNFSQASPNNSDVVLNYNAPKQPKPPAEELSRTSTPKEQSRVLCAKPVNLYQMNDSYILLGKYGLALIGTSAQADEIILYKDKRNILKRIKNTLNFEFILRSNKYLCFSDENKEFWSMTFDSAKDLNEFVQNIETCNIMVVRVKTESDSNIKISNSAGNDIKTETKTEGAIKENARLITESPSSQTRADILSRMAKMGQSILPNAVLKNSLLSDSETDDSSTSKIILNRKPRTRKDIPVTKEKHADNNKIDTIPPSTVQTLIPMAQVLPSYTPPNVTQSLPSNVIMSTLPSTIDNLNLNMYIAESRLHNGEVRMNLSTISSKIDNILTEITKLKFPSDTDQLENNFLKAKINTLETKIVFLSKTLEEKENTKSNELARLNDEIKLKDDIIQQQNEKFLQLEKYSSDEIIQFKQQTERFKTNEEELKMVIEIQKSKLIDLEMVHKSNESTDDLQKIIENLHEEVRFLTEALNDLQSKCRNLEKTKVKSFSESTKQSMNAMYQNVLKDFSGVKSDNTIQSILASNMKQTTYEIIQHFKNCVAIAEDLSGSDLKKEPPPVPDF